MGRRLLVLLAETPVHAGGAAADGAVDLPIQREASTGLPVIWGQSLKGALRDAARGQDWEVAVFGSRPPGPPAADAPTQPVEPDDPGGELSKGAVSFGDAQLLAFPAATLRNTFAWTTSELLLNRLRRKAHLLGVSLEPVLGAIAGSAETIGGEKWQHTQVIGPYLDEVTAHAGVAGVGALLGALACPLSNDFDYTRTKLAADLLVLPDQVFSELARLGTDVVARIQLETEAKAVKHGPFYSEHLPVETVLAAVLAGDEDQLAHLDDFFDGTAIQLGGDETIGKGVLWCRVHTADSVNAAVSGGARPHVEAVA